MGNDIEKVDEFNTNPLVHIFLNFALAFGPTLIVVLLHSGEMLLCGELTLGFDMCIKVSKISQGILGQFLVRAGFIASGPFVLGVHKIMTFRRRGELKNPYR